MNEKISFKQAVKSLHIYSQDAIIFFERATHLEPIDCMKVGMENIVENNRLRYKFVSLLCAMPSLSIVHMMFPWRRQTCYSMNRLLRSFLLLITEQ